MFDHVLSLRRIFGSESMAALDNNVKKSLIDYSSPISLPSFPSVEAVAGSLGLFGKG